MKFSSFFFYLYYDSTTQKAQPRKFQHVHTTGIMPADGLTINQGKKRRRRRREQNEPSPIWRLLNPRHLSNGTSYTTKVNKGQNSNQYPFPFHFPLPLLCAIYTHNPKEENLRSRPAPFWFLHPRRLTIPPLTKQSPAERKKG
jgi:hypothetical protein